MLQTTTKLPAPSRITSSSYSFHPATDCSIHAWRMGDSAIAARTASGSPAGSCTHDAPLPPSAKLARTSNG